MRISVLEVDNVSYAFINGVESVGSKWYWAILKAVIKHIGRR